MFPAYVRPTTWARGHFLVASWLPCVPVQTGNSSKGAWVVLESVRTKRYGIIVDAAAIVHSTVLLSGVRPAQTSRGAPVAHYRQTLKDLAVRFRAPYATVKPRMVRATGSYRVPGVQRFACFQSAPLQTCASSRATIAVQG